jgi:hypothetical protein
MLKNLQNLKKVATSWDKTHRLKKGNKLLSAEQKLEDFYAQAIDNILVEPTIKEQVKNLEDKHHAIVLEKE